MSPKGRRRKQGGKGNEKKKMGKNIHRKRRQTGEPIKKEVLENSNIINVRSKRRD